MRNYDHLGLILLYFRQAPVYQAEQWERRTVLVFPRHCESICRDCCWVCFPGYVVLKLCIDSICEQVDFGIPHNLLSLWLGRLFCSASSCWSPETLSTRGLLVCSGPHVGALPSGLCCGSSSTPRGMMLSETDSLISLSPSSISGSWLWCCLFLDAHVVLVPLPKGRLCRWRLGSPFCVADPSLASLVSWTNEELGRGRMAKPETDMLRLSVGTSTIFDL